MSPKTVLLSAPPGARTLDTLIKRKGSKGYFKSFFSGLRYGNRVI